MIILGAVTIFILLHLQMPLTALAILLSPFTGGISSALIVLGLVIDFQD